MRILLAAPGDGHTSFYLARAFTRAGHAVETFDYRAQAEMVGAEAMNGAFVNRKRATDLTIVLKGELIWPFNLEHTVLFNPDSWYAKDKNLIEAARNAKLFLTPSGGLVPFYKEQGINVRHFLEGADPELHRPMGDFMSDEQKLHFGADVSFVGTVADVPGRDDWLEKIGIASRGDGMLDTQFLLKIWGSFPGKLSKRWHTSERANGDAAHNCVVSATKINLDRTRTPEIEGAISARVFRVLAAGGFLLMRRQVDLFKHLPIGTVTVYDDDLSCIRAIMHFLNEPTEREVIAKEGREWCLKNATWDVRVQELLKLV